MTLSRYVGVAALLAILSSASTSDAGVNRCTTRDRLEEAFIYERAIDWPSYERQRDKLDEEAPVVEMTLNDARLDELDVEAVLGFAEHLLLNVARMWTEASLDQKQRLQQGAFH